MNRGLFGHVNVKVHHGRDFHSVDLLGFGYMRVGDLTAAYDSDPHLRMWRRETLNLDNFAKRTIRPVLEKLGLEWYGFHAFRRGLATNLEQLGVAPKDIQAIMRHADFQTTMNLYVKAVPESARKAMERLEQLICSQYAVNDDDRKAQVV